MADTEAEEHFDIAKRVIRNSSFVFLGNFISNLLGFIINILIARYLGDTFFGNYSFVFSYISFFLVLSHMGIDTILVRELSRDFGRRQKLVSNAFLLKTILSAISLLVSVVLILLLPYGSNVRLGVFFAALSLIFSSYVLTLGSLFQARLEMLYVSIASIVSKLLLFGLFFLVVLNYRGGFVMLTIASTITLAAQFFLLMLFSRKYFRLDVGFDRKTLGYLLAESWPFAVSGLLIILYLRADVFILSLVSTSASLGQYSAAYNITEATTVIAAAFMTSMFPLMASYYQKNQKRFLQLYKISFKLLVSLALPIAIGLSLLSGRIIGLVYSSGYSQSSRLLPLLSFTAACVFITLYTGPVLTVIKKQKTSMLISAILVVFNICLNLVLIPRYDSLGASISKLLTELLGAIAAIAVMARFLKEYPFDGSLAKIALASAIMGGFVLLTRQALAIYVLIPLAIALYAGLYYLFGLVGKWEIQLIRRLLLGRPNKG
jgi:O-antigen/teichoic acid export membrane protein